MRRVDLQIYIVFSMLDNFLSFRCFWAGGKMDGKTLTKLLHPLTYFTTYY